MRASEKTPGSNASTTRLARPRPQEEPAPTGSGSRVEGKRNILAIALVVVVIGSIVTMFLPVTDEARGILALVVMLCLIFLRVPVAVSLIVPALLGIWAMRGTRTVVGSLGDLPYKTVANWSLGVVPMFIFVGVILGKAGVTESIYLAARRWLGWLPGGLAVGTNLAGAGLAAVSGSTLATTYAVGRSGIPEMLKAGYSPRMAIAPVISAGLPGQLIPPSILLVVYAGIAEVPVGPQLLAGVGPGVVLALAFGAVFILLSIRRGKRPGGTSAATNDRSDEPRVGWKDRLASLGAIWPVFVVIVTIIGGMFSGVFTATEAASVAALFCVIVGFLWNGRQGWRVLSMAAVDTVRSTGAVFFLLIGASALSLMLTLSGLSKELAGAVGSWHLGRVGFLLIMIAIYLIMGMFMESLPMMLLTVPVLVPVLHALGISQLWFGAFVVLMGELSIVTPPVGILSYIIHGMTQEPEVNLGTKIGLRDVFAAAIWVVPVAVAVCMLFIFFPEIATFLPDATG